MTTYATGLGGRWGRRLHRQAPRTWRSFTPGGPILRTRQGGRVMKAEPGIRNSAPRSGYRGLTTSHLPVAAGNSRDEDFQQVDPDQRFQVTHKSSPGEAEYWSEQAALTNRQVRQLPAVQLSPGRWIRPFFGREAGTWHQSPAMNAHTH